MKIETKSVVSGKILWLEVRDKYGNLKKRLEDLPNLLLNTAMGQSLNLDGGVAYAMPSTAASYDNVPGTWSQSGNTITRATGVGTFPSSPSQLGNELYWYDASTNTGHRVHVTARASDTSITVSGPAKTITGGKLRRFWTNGQGVTSAAGLLQYSTTTSTVSSVLDYVSNPATRVITFRYQFSSAPSPYTMGSILCPTIGRILLPTTIGIDAEDQLTFVYAITETCTGRSQIYELGAESTGIPQKHSMLTVIGNGTNVDVTFSADTHFLAGDKLDMRALTPKKFAIASASSTGTTFTINTTEAHGLTTGDPVTVEGASLAGYNGTFTVATGSGTVLTITDAANPGAMGASGTVRLQTPGTYFDDLGLATIASMVSSSVARITSAITGPAVDPIQVGGDPGVTVIFAPTSNTALFTLGGYFQNNYAGFRAEGTVKAIHDPGVVQSLVNGWTTGDTLGSLQAASYSNDHVQIHRMEWNAGTGKSMTRMKQILMSGQNFNGQGCQITFNTPFNKLATQRLRIEPTKQLKRTLDLTGL